MTIDGVPINMEVGAGGLLVPKSVIAAPNIIFSTNFDSPADLAYSQNGVSQFPWSNIATLGPDGWSGANIDQPDGSITAANGEGEGGSNAMRFKWGGAGQPVSQFYKHLSNDRTKGYDRVHIRYNLRLPNEFIFGNPGNDELPYWKLGRLWQNETLVTGDVSEGVTENRPDSFYIVWNMNGDVPYGTRFGGTFAANQNPDSNGSNGGPRYSNSFYLPGDGVRSSAQLARREGMVMSVGATMNGGSDQFDEGNILTPGDWEFDQTTRLLINNTAQKFHKIEWGFRLSSSDTSNDGYYRLWIDGVEHIPRGISASSGADGSVIGVSLFPGGLPTARHGSGINFFVFMDNMAFWNHLWDTYPNADGVYVSDVVVADDYIGPGLVAQNIDNAGVGAT